MITGGLRLSGFSNPTIFELSEDGVRPCPGTPLPSGQTAFQYFFEPLWQCMNAEYLLAGHGQSPFTSGMLLETPTLEMFDAEYARWVVDLAVDRPISPEVRQQQQPDLMLFRPGVIAVWGHSVKDDWCSIIALGTNVAHALRVAAELIQLEFDQNHSLFGSTAQSLERNRTLFRETVLQEARSIFACQDGKAWDFYADAPGHLDAVAAHALSTGSFIVTQL